MITDGCQNVSFPFRTIRVGTLKLYGLGPNNPLKFDRRKLKLSVKLQLEKSVETIKLIIPCKHITEFKTFLGRGCPVIWLQTTEECAKHIRKITKMEKGTAPAPYYDPKSKVPAESYLGIVVDQDPIPYTQIFNFKQVILAICKDKEIFTEEDFYKKITQADSNVMLVEIAGMCDSIQTLQKKIATSPRTDIWKNIHKKMRNSSSLISNSSASEISKGTKKVAKSTTDSSTSGQGTGSATARRETISPLPITTTDDASPSPQRATSSSPAKTDAVSPNTMQRNLNRARKSIPKSNRSISLECQLDEIRAKAGLEPDANPVISIEAMRNTDSPSISQDTTIEQDSASDDDDDATSTISTSSTTNTKKKRPKDPFLWKGRTKKRYRKPPTDHRMMYQPPGTASPKVGQTLSTPLSTTSASTPSNIISENIHQEDENELEEASEQLIESPSNVEKCKCMDTSPHILLTGIEPIKCMGIDSVDGRLSKCTNVVQTPMMMRCSEHIPLLALCEEHRERMLRHECCPGCGMFCAGGTYLICVHVTECPHRFHKDCMLLHHQTKHCLHCVGSMSKVREVTVEPRQEYKLRWMVAGLDPNKMEKKRLNGNREKTARMGHKSCYSAGKIQDGVTKTLRPDMFVNTSELPKGKDRDLLEEALCSYFEASHKKLKIHPKNVINIIHQGDLMKLIQFLHEGEDTDVWNLLKNPSTLIRAVCNGNIAIIYLLKLVGVIFKGSDTKGKTALFYAEEYEHAELIDFLVKSGADVTHKDNEGMTCMHQAATNGRIVSCAALLSHSAKLINMTDEGGWTPIVWASEHRHTSTAKYLEHFGSDLAKTDKEKNMCLHWAALSGNLDLIIMCLQRNSDINFKNLHGDTAIHIAARQDHADCVLCLTNWGVDHTIKNNEGKTALECTFPDTDSELLLKFKQKVYDSMKYTRKQDHFSREKLMSADLSKGFEKLPLPCVNSVDDAVCPTDETDGFHYVTANVHTSGETIVKNPTNKMQSCYCYTECSDGSCLCGVMSGRCWYNREGQLVPEFDFIDAPYIVECSETCWCPPSCHNRVVQKGIRYNLQVHRTRGMGWSVRALDTIPRGAFVCEYVGELISDAEADIREDDSYLFDLENSDGEIFCIDARYYGNVSRFINHLCNPNLMPLRVFIDHHDKRFPRLAYFSTREIKAGEELGFDYGNRFWDVKCRSFTCGCGLPQCKYSEEAYRIRKELEEKNNGSVVETT